MKKIKIFSILIASVFIFSCSEDSLFNFVLGGQPNFIGDHKFVPGLNIFGVLRPDSLNSAPLSFVHVEKAVPAISDKLDTFAITDANVAVYRLQNNIPVDSIIFYYSNHYKTFKLPEYRPNTIKPVAGEHYKIVCRSTGLPELTSETIIPSIPKLEADTIIFSGNKARFTILQDTTAALYDVYLKYGNESITKRVVRSLEGNTMVEIEIPGKISQMVIYAYDIKMASYFAASNLSFKPNTYRPPFTNVSGGYGSFGSMNIYQKNF